MIFDFFFFTNFRRRNKESSSIRSKSFLMLAFQGLRGDPGEPGLPGAQGSAGLPVQTSFQTSMNDYKILSSDQIITCVCCLPSGDAWHSGLTRKQGQSADFTSCDLSQTSDDNVLLFQGQEGPSPVIPGPQGQKVSRFPANSWPYSSQWLDLSLCCSVGSKREETTWIMERTTMIPESACLEQRRQHFLHNIIKTFWPTESQNHI